VSGRVELGRGAGQELLVAHVALAQQARGLGELRQDRLERQAEPVRELVQGPALGGGERLLDHRRGSDVPAARHPRALGHPFHRSPEH